MNQRIIGFHQDDQGDWGARRDDPPVA